MTVIPKKSQDRKARIVYQYEVFIGPTTTLEGEPAKDEYSVIIACRSGPNTKDLCFKENKRFYVYGKDSDIGDFFRVEDNVIQLFHSASEGQPIKIEKAYIVSNRLTGGKAYIGNDGIWRKL
jgi:hypothetical protein